MFSHEKLTVYHKAIAFVAWTQPLLAELPAKTSAKDQLDRASTSIPLNIAEGNAKFSIPDRARYLQTALGSAVECAACLDVLTARGMLAGAPAEIGKQYLEVIVSMMMGLLDRLGYRFELGEPSARVREDGHDEFGGGWLVREGRDGERTGEG
jgi:four helix bundle protein